MVMHISKEASWSMSLVGPCSQRTRVLSVWRPTVQVNMSHEVYPSMSYMYCLCEYCMAHGGERTSSVIGVPRRV